MIELVRKPSDIFAFDSVSHWLCNYTADLSTGYDECKVEESLAVFCSEFLMEIQRLRLEKDIVIVSTDFSQGPPPSDAQTRLVRQYNGIMSQGIAALAKQVFVLIAGCPMLIKG
jgi:adenosyl cobinamide kinase/adenosyl cobinamide phosphate guanylyltransferase